MFFDRLAWPESGLERAEIHMIKCLRKDGHVLIPNWSQDKPDAEIIFEVRLLCAIGYEQSELTEKEMAALQANILSSES